MGLPFKKRFNSSLKLKKCQRGTQCVKYKLREVARIMLESTGESDETKNELLQRFECEHELIANHEVDTPMDVEEDIQGKMLTTPDRSPPLHTSTPYPHLVQAEPMDLSMRDHRLNMLGQCIRKIDNDANNEQSQEEPLNLCLNNRTDENDVHEDQDLESNFDRDASTKDFSTTDDLDLDEFDIEENTVDRQVDVEEDAEDVSLYPEPYVYDDIDQYEENIGGPDRSVVPFPSLCQDEPINLSVRTENNEGPQPTSNIGESEEEIHVGQQQPLDLRGNRRKCRKTLEF